MFPINFTPLLREIRNGTFGQNDPDPNPAAAAAAPQFDGLQPMPEMSGAPAPTEPALRFAASEAYTGRNRSRTPFYGANPLIGLGVSAPLGAIGIERSLFIKRR